VQFKDLPNGAIFRAYPYHDLLMKCLAVEKTRYNAASLSRGNFVCIAESVEVKLLHDSFEEFLSDCGI
jgi:hypothetical protein